MDTTHKLNSTKFIVLLTAVVYVLMLITNYIDPIIYQKYLGNANPLLFFILFPAFGIFLIKILKLEGEFGFYSGITKHSLTKVLIVPVCLALVPILLVDIFVPFAQDINVLFPLSLLFYPTIAFFVEMLFHVIPLMLLMYIFFRLLKLQKKQTLIWVFIFIIALSESLFQADFMMQNSYFPLCATLVASLNIYLFNIYELYIFKRYGFIIMFSVRLVYYLIWHIIWGYLRLQILF